MSRSNQPQVHIMKVILVGTSGVGKTSLVSAYFDNPFDVQALPTVAPASCNATIELPGNIKVELQIWDTAGQERFQAISQMFYRDSNIAFVCYDQNTIETVDDWIEKVRAEVPDCLIFLVLTKCDMLSEEQKAIFEDKGKDLKEKTGSSFFIMTSSSLKTGVKSLFTEAAKSYSIVFQSNQPIIDIGGDSQTRSKSCC